MHFLQKIIKIGTFFSIFSVTLIYELIILRLLANFA